MRLSWAKHSLQSAYPVATLIAIFLGLASIVSGVFGIYLISFFLLFIVFVSNLPVFLPLLLATRSSLDITTNFAFYLGPLKFNPAAVLALLLCGGGILYLSMRLLKGRLHIDRISKVFLFWLILLIPWVFVSINNLGYRGMIGIREWTRLFTLFIIYLLVFNTVNKANFKKYITLLFLSLLGPLIVSIYQITTGSWGISSGGIKRVSGTIAHPIALSFYLILFISLTFWKIKTSKKRNIWFFLLLLLLLIFFFTFSWTGIVMLAVLLLLFFFKERKIQKYVSLILIVFVLFAVSSGQMRLRFQRLVQGNILESIQTEKSVNTLTWRVLCWKQLLSRWKEKPLVGYGLATGELINPWKGHSPHSDLVRYLVELGIIGFSAYLFFIFSVGRRIYIMYKQTKDRDLRIFLFSVFVAFLCWQIASTVGNAITMTTFQFYFWAILGISSKMFFLENVQRRKEDFGHAL